MFKMIVGSDLVPIDTNLDLFESGANETLAGKALLDVLNACDFRVFNLETPIADNEAPIKKCGPHLLAPTRTMPGIKGFNPSLLALANNHIMDHGEQGLYSTLDELDKWDIPYIGVGKDLEEAQKPFIIENAGKKIGIYNAAEHEFSIAGKDKAGANPFDLLESFDHIANLKSECNFVVVLYHGGKEHYRYPSPNLQKVCRKMAEKGADLIICQHTHCIGAMEEYKGSTIVYGQGNFLFDHSKREEWQTSLLVKAEFGEKMQVDFIPIRKQENCVRLAEGIDAEEILEAFKTRSEEIKEDGFIYEKYKEFCFSEKKWYLYAMAGGSANLGVNSVEFEPKYSEWGLLCMMNYCICEPHHELLTTLVTELAKEKAEEEK